MKNIKLYNFVNIYFNEKNEKLDTISNLSNFLNSSPSEIKTYRNYFIKCNFLYEHNKDTYIFKTKQNFSSNFKLIEECGYINILGDNFVISLNKDELLDLEPTFDINHKYLINDIVYFLFLFITTYNTFEEKTCFIDNNIMWYEKKCYYVHSNRYLYLCKFNQKNDNIKFYNYD